jgi:hypothetical protein
MDDLNPEKDRRPAKNALWTFYPNKTLKNPSPA